MASNINPNEISGTAPTAQSVQDNFVRAQAEITNLQASVEGAGSLLAPGPPGPAGPHPFGTLWINETPSPGNKRVSVWIGGAASTHTDNWAEVVGY